MASTKKLLQIDPRAYNMMKSSTITNIYDAIIELTTNCDDAYGKSKIETNKKMEIEIDYSPFSDTEHSGILIIRDHALGLTSHQMEKCFLQVGQFTANDTSRGFFSRGAKDITALGIVTFEAIKDNKYSKITLDTESYAQIYEQDIDVTEEIRKKLKMDVNGLQVSIMVEKKFPIVGHEILEKEIPSLVSLRNIFNSKHNHITLSTRNYLGDPENNKTSRLSYNFPEGVPVLELTFQVPNFDVEANFIVYKSDTAFEKPENNKLQ